MEMEETRTSAMQMPRQISGQGGQGTRSRKSSFVSPALQPEARDCSEVAQFADQAPEEEPMRLDGLRQSLGHTY